MLVFPPMLMSRCCRTASPETTPKLRPPDTSWPLRPIELGFVKPPARDISCRAPHSGQNILSSGICSLQEPQSTIPTPGFGARITPPKGLRRITAVIEGKISTSSSPKPNKNLREYRVKNLCRDEYSNVLIANSIRPQGQEERVVPLN